MNKSCHGVYISLVDINILGGNKRSGRANEILAPQNTNCALGGKTSS